MCNKYGNFILKLINNAQIWNSTSYRTWDYILDTRLYLSKSQYNIIGPITISPYLHMMVKIQKNIHIKSRHNLTIQTKYGVRDVTKQMTDVSCSIFAVQRFVQLATSQLMSVPARPRPPGSTNVRPLMAVPNQNTYLLHAPCTLSYINIIQVQNMHCAGIVLEFIG